LNVGFHAIQLILRYAFTKLKLHRVEANIQPENLASLALIKRAGFTREGYSRRYLRIGGRWRDHERWALLAEDWKVASKLQRTIE
jgi:ribosomal-protein-alanine N-acetyltransferase